MQRNMDLIREILLALEKHPHGFVKGMVSIEGYDEEEIGYHAYLAKEAGLIRGAATSHQGSESPSVMPSGLTWEGHEFVESARQPERWAKARAAIGKVGGVAMPVWISLLTELARKQLGIGE